MVMPLSRAMSQRAFLLSSVRTPPVGLEGVFTTIMDVFGVIFDWMSSMSGWNVPSSVSLYPTASAPASSAWGL